MVYANVSGFNNHAFNCYDCISYLHYANTYNIVLSSLATDSIANVAVTTDSRLATDADYSRDCDKILDDLWGNLCVKGAHCVVRYVDLWNDNDFETRYSMTVGSEKTITVWAEQGFCDKNSLSATAKNFRSYLDMIESEMSFL